MDKKLTFLELPEDLPIPHDDGACNHLLGLSIPKILLRATNNELVNLSELDGCLVVYCYPMTGRPDKNLPMVGMKYLEQEAVHRNLVLFATIIMNCKL